MRCPNALQNTEASRLHDTLQHTFRFNVQCAASSHTRPCAIVSHPYINIFKFICSWTRARVRITIDQREREKETTVESIQALLLHDAPNKRACVHTAGRPDDAFIAA